MCTHVLTQQLHPVGQQPHLHKDRPQNISQPCRCVCTNLSHLSARAGRNAGTSFEFVTVGSRGAGFPSASFRPLISDFLSRERKSGFRSHKSFMEAIKGSVWTARPSELSLLLFYKLQKPEEASQDLPWKSGRFLASDATAAQQIFSLKPRQDKVKMDPTGRLNAKFYLELRQRRFIREELTPDLIRASFVVSEHRYI